VPAYRPHVPHEPGSVLQSRQLDPRPFLRLDNARQLEAEIMLLGVRHGPILRHLNERYHTQTPNGRNVPDSCTAQIFREEEWYPPPWHSCAVEVSTSGGVTSTLDVRSGRSPIYKFATN
jgi:hypothetical protein